MTDDWLERLGVPGLLRGARRAYSAAIRAALIDAGFDDLPRNGAAVLARVHDSASPLPDLTRQLNISKQAVSLLIDTMVMRGYLDRTPDTEDRRRMLLRLTPRGEAAGQVAWEAAAEVDQELERRLSAEGVASLRASLIVMAEMGLRHTSEQSS
ncbi:MAG: MarR family winged helix-turn-helix transcriptional regulator [Streptosporangiaceae bacterium]